VHDSCVGVVVYLHSFLTSTLDGVVSCSLLTAAAIFRTDAASDTPLVGGREAHRSRLDTLDNLRNFTHGRESIRAIQSAACMTFAPFSRTQHQSCMWGTVLYKPLSNIKVTNSQTTRTLSLLDVYMALGWQMVDTIPLRSHY